MTRVFIPAAIIAVAVLAAIVTSRGDGKEERTAYRFAVAVRNVNEPTHVTAPRNEPNNLYIVEKGGRIRVRVRGRLRARPFLNISRSVSTGSEQGLLSMAFHPNYARNRRFYINYTDTSGDTRVVEYRTRGLTVLTRTRRQVLFVNQPYSNHNGGQVAFGPDGWLYVGMGDGGSGGDPENRAQNMRQLLGKMLRINVNSRRPVVQITALGLRNPWRFSFDRQTGDLYIGDVGQNAWEEVNFTARSSTGRENYGWRVFEGRARFTNETPNPAGRLVMPIAVLPNPPHCSVIGGFVYRGRSVPAARGRYFLGDNCNDQIRTLAAPGGTQLRNEPFRVSGLSSFGEDARGELYATSLNGAVYRLVP